MKFGTIITVRYKIHHMCTEMLFFVESCMTRVNESGIVQWHIVNSGWEELAHWFNPPRCWIFWPLLLFSQLISDLSELWFDWIVTWPWVIVIYSNIYIFNSYQLVCNRNSQMASEIYNYSRAFFVVLACEKVSSNLVCCNCSERSEQWV